MIMCKNCMIVELTGRQKGFCSDKCRMQFKRKLNSEPEQTKVEQSAGPEPEQFSIVTAVAPVYGRIPVQYEGDKFETRPSPLDPADQPHSGGRGRYTRTDGTVYQFDCRGHSFECKHPFKDKYGNEHLAVYETIADVQAAPVDESKVKV